MANGDDDDDYDNRSSNSNNNIDDNDKAMTINLWFSLSCGFFADHIINGGFGGVFFLLCADCLQWLGVENILKTAIFIFVIIYYYFEFKGTAHSTNNNGNHMRDPTHSPTRTHTRQSQTTCRINWEWVSNCSGKSVTNLKKKGDEKNCKTVREMKKIWKMYANSETHTHTYTHSVNRSLACKFCVTAQHAWTCALEFNLHNNVSVP